MSAEVEAPTCAICLEPCTEPLLLSVCRHTFCAVCILACHGANGKVVPCRLKKFKLCVDPKCPVCRLPFALEPEKSLQFLVSANSEARECGGCAHALESAQELVPHLTRDCVKSLTPCPLCAENFQINHFDAHLRNHCTRVPCTCCALTGPWSFIKAHTSNFDVNKLNHASVQTMRELSESVSLTEQPLDVLRVCAKVLSHTFTATTGFEGHTPDFQALSRWRARLPPSIWAASPHTSLPRPFHPSPSLLHSRPEPRAFGFAPAQALRRRPEG
jgi:hypothetical protein